MIKMILCEATMEDARCLFNWRNDPQTRASSINTRELKWEDHIAWLQRSLTDPDRQVFIVIEDKVPVGTVRLDHDGELATLLSWTVAPGMRGRGYGQTMVRLAVESVKSSGRYPMAKIRPANIASVKIVEALGFVKESTETDADGTVTWKL